MKKVKDFVDIHKGKTAWMFGKGKSLELIRVIDIPSDDICVSINEAFKLMPRVDYIVGHSHKQNFKCGSGIFVLNEVDAEKALEVDDNNKLLYHLVNNKNIPEANDAISNGIDFVKENSLIGITGSCHPALHLLKITGIDTVNLVGFDGDEEGYCELIHSDFIPSKAFVYATIFRDIVELSRLFKMRLIRHLSKIEAGKKIVYTQIYDWRIKK